MKILVETHLTTDVLVFGDHHRHIDMLPTEMKYTIHIIIKTQL